ncbi:hypothetical protein MSBR2_2472 [Methanosarcina barkeri 227]|uniref:Uncharacterized protein n=1 Tax=Methanosarcina barkeri 227 TaxID=1434106 RepID=A0A0E3R5U8_METBA|nr:hypothetical protein MSBR2_2472 [Methanosarcina barkeri 227]
MSILKCLQLNYRLSAATISSSGKSSGKASENWIIWRRFFYSNPRPNSAVNSLPSEMTIFCPYSALSPLRISS